MEREVLLTGVGGQGVQLAAQVIGRAAVLEGREVMMLGLYSGVMRGGSSDCSVVVGTGLVRCPPVVSHAWSALAMDHRFWEPVRRRLRPGALVAVNSTLFEGVLDTDELRVLKVPATETAICLGNEMGAALVMVGAYLSATGLVSLASAVEAMVDSLPPYRRQHAAANEEALRAGAELVAEVIVPAWDGDATARAAGGMTASGSGRGATGAAR